jgi:hypothetical protein
MRTWIKLNKVSWLAVLVMVLAAPGAVQGTPLSINNASFETDNPPSGGSTQWYVFSQNSSAYNESITDWTMSTMSGQGHAGTWIAPTEAYPQGLPDGTHIAHVHTATISQILTATLVADADYTLQVSVGYRFWQPPFPGYEVALYSGSNKLAWDSSLSPGRGLWATDTLTYHATAESPGLGEPLKIMLTANGNVVDFDKVSLDVVLPAPVPLPPTLLLLGSGLLGLAGWRRFRKG